jgi:hypothetical protein
MIKQKKDSKISILLAIPHAGETVPGLEMKLAKWIYESPYNIEFRLSQINPTYSNRNAICNYFLKSKHTHLLTIDSDTVPMDNPLKMIERDVDVVGGVYPAWKLDHFYWLATIEQPDGSYETISADKRKGMVEVDGLGAGCMLIKRKVIEALKAPFADKIREDGTRSIGHDYYFCKRAKEKGFKVYADWDILCDHVKQVPLIHIIEALKKTYDKGVEDGKKLTNEVNNSMIDYHNLKE